MSVMSARGFWGTLRQMSNLLRIDDSVVCLADLMQQPGHELFHVLSLSGWKTKVVLQSFQLKMINEARLLGGNGQGLPEANVLEFDTEMEEISLGGPSAYAAGLEMLRRAELCDEDSWMRDYAMSALRSSSPQNSGTYERGSTFDLEATRQKLKEASRGEIIPNPEHSTDWMHLFADSSALNPFVRGERARTGACQKCGVPEERLSGSKLKACKRCMNVFYCSRKCQQEDWKQHKKVCISKDK